MSGRSFATEGRVAKLSRKRSQTASFTLSVANSRLASGERELSWLRAVIGAARAIRAEHDLAPKKRLTLTLRTSEPDKRALLEAQQTAIETLVNAALSIEDAQDSVPEHTATAVAEGITVLVPLAGLVDMGKEKERLARELTKVEKDLATLTKKLGNADFLARLFDGADEESGVALKLPARRRERGAQLVANEEFRAELFLEALDTGAHRGLRDVQP